MLDDRKRQIVDQLSAEAGETLPTYWYSLYRGAQTAGFSERQAFALLRTFILAMFGKGVLPPDAEPDDLKSDD